jgi:hypothetical protein
MARKVPDLSRTGLRRRDLLLAATAVAGVPRYAFSQSTDGSGKPVIVVFAEGGWDVTFCFDPKLDIGETIDGPESHTDTEPLGTEVVETFGNLTVQLNDLRRPNARPFFETWHPWTHIINGVWTGSIAHDPCRYRMLTGDPSGRKPDLASITGFEYGAALPLGAVDLSGWSIAGSLASSTGRVGDQNQIVALIDDALPTNQEFSQPPSFPWDYPLSSLAPTDSDTIAAFVAARAERLRGRFGDGGHNDKLIDDLVDSLDRGGRFRDNAAGILGGDGATALKLGRRSDFFDQIVISVDLIEKGLCHSVTIDTREDWDSHEANINQHYYYNVLFDGLDELMTILQAKGMLDKVVVAVISEMTRTPKLNKAGGKDHWAHTSAMLLGAVKGNAMSGGTDELLESRRVDLETGELQDEANGGELNKYDNLAAGILDLAGVDPAKWLPGVVPFRGAHPV